MAASHQHKRPYAGSQPSITAYFPQAISPTSTFQQTYSITPSHPPPTNDRTQLPAHIQSNLLSVGMRVRKSVPEGYKTGTAYSAFTLFADSPSPISSSTVQDVTRSAAPPVRNRPRARELTPFCGILKVGGMAQQQWGIYNTSSSVLMGGRRCEEEVEEGEEEGNEVPSLSQGSTGSDFSVASLGERKRRVEFDDEDTEEQVEVARDRVNIMGLGERVMAVPRRKRGAFKDLEVVGQENLDADVDFEEADFLDYELTGDSEMGGV